VEYRVSLKAPPLLVCTKNTALGWVSRGKYTFCISVFHQYQDRKSSRYRYIHLVRNTCLRVTNVFTNAFFFISMLLWLLKSSVSHCFGQYIGPLKAFFIVKIVANRYIGSITYVGLKILSSYQNVGKMSYQCNTNIWFLVVETILRLVWL